MDTLDVETTTPDATPAELVREAIQTISRLLDTCRTSVESGHRVTGNEKLTCERLVVQCRELLLAQGQAQVFRENQRFRWSETPSLLKEKL